MNNRIKALTLLIGLLRLGTANASERADLGWQMIESGAMVIDVRTPEEFNAGHLSGAINIPLSEIEQGFSSIDKGTPIVLYCHSGARSGRAHYYLESIGFNQLHNAGGLEEMNSAKPAIQN